MGINKEKKALKNVFVLVLCKSDCPLSILFTMFLIVSPRILIT